MQTKDLLVKLTYPFRVDSYIIDKKYILAGPESMDKNIGTCMCVLKDDAISSIENSIKDINEVSMITDISLMKKKLTDGFISSVPEQEKFVVLERLEEINNQLANIQSWSSLNLSEEEFNKFFVDKIAIDLFEDDKEKSTLKISISAFPMLSEKNYDYFKVSWFHLDDVELDVLATKLEHDYFTLYNILYYLSV